MTQEHLTDQQVEAYRRRSADTSEGSALASHMAACESCLARVIDPAHVGVAFTSLKESFLSRADEEPFHLSREELKRYSAGQMDQADRTIFESHLEDCADCDKLVQDLVLVSPVVAPGEGISASATASLWSRFLYSWRRSPALRPVYIGGIAAVVVSATLLILFIRSKDSSGGAQVSVPQTASTGTRDQNQPAPTPTSTQAGSQPGDELGSNQNSGPGPATDRSPSDSTRPEEIARLVDGTVEVTLDKQGRLSGVDGISKSIQTAVRYALSNREMERPRVLDELKSPSITLLGQPSVSTPIALLAPLGVVSLDDRPTFNWQPLSDATDYTISVFDANFNRVLRSPRQSANSWTVSAPLKRGRTYFWEVTAIKDGQEITSPVAPAPRAQFKIVDANTAAEIAQAKKARPGSHLVLGILYARAGLIDDAERELQLLVNANPNSEVARRLLSSVRSWKKR